MHPDFRPGMTLAGQCKDAENAKGVKQIRIKGCFTVQLICSFFFFFFFLLFFCICAKFVFLCSGLIGIITLLGTMGTRKHANIEDFLM